MTSASYVTVWCDGKVPPAAVDCGAYIEGDSAAEIRKRIRGSWLVGLPGGRDLCPRHHDQRDAPTRWGDTAAASVLTAAGEDSG